MALEVAGVRYGLSPFGNPSDIFYGVARSDLSPCRKTSGQRENLTRTRADAIFALQEEITRQVAVAMQVKFTSGDYARLWDGQTRSLAAWERCVVADAHHERWSEADNRRARDLLQEALEIDPDRQGIAR
ncbi:hypothetical protein [Mesorhizobium sp. 43Arga]